MIPFLLEPGNAVLVILALVSAALLIWPVLRARAGGPTLSAQDTVKLMNSRQVQIVDVRTAEEFALGSLLNARHVPVAEIAARSGELRTDLPAVVVCETGRRASLASVKLRSAGIAEVFILEGGLQAWRSAGLPITRAA
jgi:rhodanese-related sulfurtransferase